MNYQPTQLIEQLVPPVKVNVCPICGAGLCTEQPQMGTHGYTDVYTCGTHIDRAFGYKEYAHITKKCKETPSDTVIQNYGK